MPDDDALEDGGQSGGQSQSLGRISSHPPMEILSGLVAVISVGASVTGMIMTGFGTVVVISGILTSVIAPYSYYQQTKLTDILALKLTQEAVRREVNRLAEENIRLHETVGKLSDTMDGLEDVEQALDVITQTQGASIDTFREQVEENREILETLKKQHRGNVLQNLLQVVIRSDQDDNMTIEEDEIAPLLNRIKKINGVEVMEDRFRNMIISSGGSLSAVMDIIKNLMADDIPGGEEIFKIKHE
mmetsp:Transcript_1807/g.4178  ORF Transcript_1807/g.4178 Transcript_1807/m.4178 type:complete len:245 (-) Transcript_1807:24-758(-)